MRWFGRDLTPNPGWKAKRLFRLGFVPRNDEMAFGFIDPIQIIRSVHLIPAFSWGHVTKYIPQQSIIARGTKEPNDDWQLYYVVNPRVSPARPVSVPVPVHAGKGFSGYR